MTHHYPTGFGWVFLAAIALGAAISYGYIWWAGWRYRKGKSSKAPPAS